MISQAQNAALRTVATAAASHAGWRLYADYCRLREQGLRKEAFKSLERFLSDTTSWTYEQKTEFVIWLCRLMDSVKEASYGPYPEPLRKALFLPFFAEWISREPRNELAHVWRAKYLMQHEGYNQALEINPHNQPARIALAAKCSYALYYDTHHLPEYFIGEVTDTKSAAREAREHLKFVTDAPTKQAILAEVDYYEQLVDDWINFQAAGATDFNAWCRDLGRDYKWVRAYYYEK